MASSITIPFVITFFAFLHVTTFATNILNGIGFHYDDKWSGECLTSKFQSPINIVKNKTVTNKKLKPIVAEYESKANATLINYGHGVGIKFEKKAGFVKIEGKVFYLHDLHWHCPSEHRINGEQFPAEVQIGHKADDGSNVMVSILYQYGENNDTLVSKVWDKLENLAKERCDEDEESHIMIGELDTNELSKKSRKYYTYLGSLTVPPCTPNITWTILSKVRSISKAQVTALKAPLGSSFKNNARPLQSLNGRKVELYSEMEDD